MIKFPKMMEIVKKGKIGWVISDNSVVAFDKFQATCYHIYNSPNKSSLESLKWKLKNSPDDMYGNWVDAIELTQALGIVGYGTRVKNDWFEKDKLD